MPAESKQKKRSAKTHWLNSPRSVLSAEILQAVEQMDLKAGPKQQLPDISDDDDDRLC